MTIDPQELAKRVDGARAIFSRAFLAHISNFGSITNFRRVICAGLPLAHGQIAYEDFQTIYHFLTDPQRRKMFLDPDTLIAEGKHISLAEQATQMAFATAENATDASSLVFAHAVLDATLYDFCRACALVAFPDWVHLIEKKKVEVGMLTKTTSLQLVHAVVEEYVRTLEKESLLKKADVLHQVCRPDPSFPSTGSFSYSRERLEQLDGLRHRVVHGSAFHESIPAIEDDIEYLMLTACYFVSMLNHRYHLQIDVSVKPEESNRGR